MAAAADAKKAKMKQKFDSLDKDGNGLLDLDELGALLRQGNPSFSDKDIKKLYDGCDLNHDGKVSFDEFLSYVYKEERGTGGRHARLHAGAGVGVDDSEIPWDGCKSTFQAFAGDDMDGKEFNKFCKDNHLVGHGMQKTDVDLIFAKVVPKGKRRMDFTMFQDACRHIASKRGQPNGDIQKIIEKSTGPALSGTKAEYSKFFDDKSTYTGAATHNDKLGADPNAALGRHERQQAAADAAIHGGDAAKEDDWGTVQKVFEEFAGPGGELDGREFLGMVKDCNLIGHGFAKTDVDMIFAGVARKAKKIGFEQFKDTVRKIAAKKSQGVSVVQDQIGSSKKQLHGVTKTDDVRFHDDKSTYTGAHAEDGHGPDKHEAAKLAAAEGLGPTEDEHPWDDVVAVYYKFAGDDGIDGREFAKLCLDCELLDKNYTKQDVDIVFASAKDKGERKLNADTFVTALRMVAKKKQCPVSQVQGKVASSAGPHINATKTDAVRFHDDKSTYTGAHAE